MTTSVRSEEITAQQVDPVQASEEIPNLDQQANPPEGMVDMLHVENIRKFFDHKAECFRSDKLSQSYIMTTFAEDELWNYAKETLKVTDEHKDEYQISINDLRVMFQAYCQDPEFSPTLKYPKESWKILKKGKLKELWSWSKQTPTSIILSNVWKSVASVSVIGTVVSFIWNTPVREQQKYFQAWQVINTAQNQSGTGGRNEALNYLNGGETIPILNWAAPKCKKNNTCLVGIKMTGLREGANLNDVDLENANLEASSFDGTSFRRANLKNAKFKNVDIKGAVFEGANLTRADFSEAINLNDKSFKGAKYCNTKMPGLKVVNPDCWSFSILGLTLSNF